MCCGIVDGMVRAHQFLEPPRRGTAAEIGATSELPVVEAARPAGAAAAGDGTRRRPAREMIGMLS